MKQQLCSSYPRERERERAFGKFHRCDRTEFPVTGEISITFKLGTRLTGRGWNDRCVTNDSGLIERRGLCRNPEAEVAVLSNEREHAKIRNPRRAWPLTSQLRRPGKYLVTAWWVRARTANDEIRTRSHYATILLTAAEKKKERGRELALSNPRAKPAPKR